MTTTKAAACACVAVGVDAVEVRISYGPIASVWEDRSQLPVLSTIDPTASFPLQSGEGMDRDSLAFSAADDAMVAAVLAANPRTIVVLRCPDVYLMVETAYTPVILNQLYGGQEVWTGVVPVGRRHERSGGPLPLPKRRPHSPTPPNSADALWHRQPVRMPHSVLPRQGHGHVALASGSGSRRRHPTRASCRCVAWMIGREICPSHSSLSGTLAG